MLGVWGEYVDGRHKLQALVYDILPSRMLGVCGRDTPSKTPVGVMPWACQSEGKDRADRLAVKATFTSGLRLGRSEVLRSL